MLLNNENIRSVQRMEEPGDENEDAIDFDEEEEDEGGEEGWMASYSDLVTDLMAVFVILYAFAAISTSHENKALKTENQSVTEQNQQIKHEVEEVISKVKEMREENNDSDNTNNNDTEAILEQVEELLQSLGIISGAGDANSLDVELNNKFDSIYELIKNKISEEGYSDMIDFKKGNGFYTFAFKDKLLFYPDSPKMREESFGIVEYIGDLLKSVDNSIESIEIAGHTADVGPDINFFSWELSSNRALTVLKFLIENSELPESKMSLAAWSKNKQVAQNDTEANRALNRRVEMKVYRINSSKTQ